MIRFILKNLVLISLFGFISCAGYTTKKNLFLDEHAAIYTVDLTPVLSETVEPPTTFPDLSLKKIVSLLGNLQYKKSGVLTNEMGRVYRHEELEYIAPLIEAELKKLETGEALLLLTRFDPLKTPLSRMERVTLLMWNDTSRLNLVFGDLRQSLIYEYMGSNTEWLSVYPIDLKESESCCEVMGPPEFEYKKIGDSVHKKWVRIAVDSLSKLKYSNTKILPEQKSGLAPSDKTIEGKRELLKRAYDSGLLTREEYEEKQKKLE